MTSPDSKLTLPVFPKLTGKQLECLRFVFEFYSEHLHYPSRREVAEAMHISSPGANQHLEALIKKGYLLRVEGESRNVRINPDTELVLQHLGIIKSEGGSHGTA